jgi:hypothetical protein
VAESPWIESNVGPLLLVPEALLPAWSGTDVPAGRTVDATFRWQGSGPATDYDRACDVRDYVAVIPVGAGRALVLADEPLPTKWLPAADGGLLARWIYGESEAAADRALTAVPGDLAWKSCGAFDVHASPLRLIDSADTGRDLTLPSARIALPPGRYDVEWARFEPDPETAFLLVRLSLRPAFRPSA